MVKDNNWNKREVYTMLLRMLLFFPCVAFAADWGRYDTPPPSVGEMQIIRIPIPPMVTPPSVPIVKLPVVPIPQYICSPSGMNCRRK